MGIVLIDASPHCSNWSQGCSIGLRSGEQAGHSIVCICCCALNSSQLNTRAKNSKRPTPSFTRVQFCDLSFEPPIHLNEFRICRFQFASEKRNLHSSPKDPGQTAIKYFILRYRHQYIRHCDKKYRFYFFEKCINRWQGLTYNCMNLLYIHFDEPGHDL